ncbi:MAG TPA: hypothetical protein VIF63_06825 [Candidatus Limnocylindrales bacterium]
MSAPKRRLRQSAVLVVFALSVVATAATSPSYTTIQFAPASDTLHLDAEHPAALARIVVKVNAEGTSDSATYGVRLRIAGITPEAGGTMLPFDVAAARFIVMSAVPGGPMPGGLVPGLPTDEPNLGPVPSAWQAEAQVPGEVQLPMQCGAGPCERAFWLVAQLVDGHVGAVSVDWTVSGSLGFSAQTWPSGAGGSIEIDPPIFVAGPIPQLVTTTEPEELRLGPTSPAAARVVEVRIGADAITGDGSAVGTMSVDLSSRPGASYDSEHRPIVHVYPLLGFDEPPGTGFLPDPADDGVDPFADCEPGVDCVRRFLVTFAWNGVDGQDALYDWNLRVRRLDLIRAWSTPVELSAAIVRRIDVAPGSASKVVHLGGDEQTTPGGSEPEPQIRVGLEGSTPAEDRLARLLPVPAVMTYRVHVLRNDPAATQDPREFSNVQLPGERIGAHVHLDFFRGEDSVVTNPLAACRIGDVCDDMTISIIRVGPLDKDPLPPVTAHWSLDILTYSYVDIPVELSVDRRP